MCYRYKKTAINILCGGASAYGSGCQTRLLDFASNTATIPEQRPGWQGKNLLDFLSSTCDNPGMKYQIIKTAIYEKWFSRLKDHQAKKRIFSRLSFIRRGHFGDHKQVGNNLFELKFFFGPGYRIYYTIQDSEVIFLIAGGDKSSQEKDIKRAEEILAALED